jgi:S-adenosylmethionine:tRNA ribosyltransferase-isomerase
VYPYHAAKLLIVQEWHDVGGSRHAPEQLAIQDSTFEQLPGLLEPGDVLVFNDTRVDTARLFGNFKRGPAELLLIEQLPEPQLWACLARPLRKIIADGGTLELAHGVTARFEGRRSDSSDRLAIFSFTRNGEILSREEVLALGHMPIPPYIRSGVADEADVIDYQTIFAEHAGSVAAPTASLHFTPDLMQALAARGVVDYRITLHVGTASFLPLFEGENPETLKAPEAETFAVSAQVVKACMHAVASGKRVVAVGTTVARALETAVSGQDSGSTSLFITPDYRFKLLTHLITNFHQPGTTHLFIVEAALGLATLGQVYQHALSNDYRFLSYGDGMCIPVRRAT